MPELATQDNEAVNRFKQAYKAKQSGMRFNTIRLFNNKVGKNTGDLDPTFGKLYALSYNGEEEEKTEIDITDTEFFLLGTRVQVSSKQFIKMSDGKLRPQYTIPEVSDYTDITITDTATKEVVAFGPYKDLKDKFDLRYGAVCYVLMRTSQGNDPAVYRWEIRGKSLTDFFDLKNTLYAYNAEGKPHTFKVKAITAELNGTVWFNTMSLGEGEAFPLDLAMYYFNQMDAFFNNSPVQTVQKLPLSTSAQPNEEEIKIEDLPF